MPWGFFNGTIQVMSNSGFELVFYVISAVLLGGLIFLFWQIKALKQKVEVFFRGGGENFEEMTIKSIRRLERAEQILEELYKNHNLTQELARKGLHKVSVTRFNPFREIGGDQSFCVAFLDDFDNGLVISSLHGREGTRIYAKPLKRGLSSYQLTSEEEEAIAKAAGSELESRNFKSNGEINGEK